MHNINLQKLRFRSNNATTTTLLSSFAEMRNWIIVYYNNVPVLYLLHNLIIKEVRARYCTVPLKNFASNTPTSWYFNILLVKIGASFISRHQSEDWDNFGQKQTYKKKHKGKTCVTNCKKHLTIKLNEKYQFL